MHIYRSNTCGTLSSQDEGKTVRLSGWVFRRRDHGHLVFIDLRDSTGVIQLVGDAKQFSSISLESVICVTGVIHARSAETVNMELPTGSIELHVEVVQILSKAAILPLSINKKNVNYPEDLRLKYRYLDLRRDEVRANMMLRIQVISYLRTIMNQYGFLECQTPILTASSPEGARDFLVPSRLHFGKFYALPQAPQQFKQLLMVAGFDRYFQISPCFRDEDARADRSPGEFYQLDIEMSFVTQEDIFQVIEKVLYHVFSEFSSKRITSYPFPRITYHEAIESYGSDKPDLRNPLRIVNVTEIFRNSSFDIFASAVESGAVVRAIFVANVTETKRRTFDELNEWAKVQGLPGLAYLIYKNGLFVGTIAKYLLEDNLKKLINVCNVELHNGVIFFMCGHKKHLEKCAGLVRTKLAETFQLIDSDSFEFLWVVDFPMYELNEKTGDIQFSHNPFSMPQGGMESLRTKNPLDILAYQYDIICNGVELSSGAIRNHLLDVLYKAFEIAGYSDKCVDMQFPSIIEAFQFGVPPHGGCAPGIDRIVMLLAGAKNLREIILFPVNQMGEDLMMRAPSFVSEQQLKELGLSLITSENK